jgi:mRNA-degrading endonuclease toxin of MazEF toxin-antitoxin module
LIVPLTSQLDALRFPGTVLVDASQHNGLRHNSVALVFQLTAVDKRYISERLGKAADAVMAQIWSTLDALTGRV